MFPLRQQVRTYPSVGLSKQELLVLKTTLSNLFERTRALADMRMTVSPTC